MKKIIIWALCILFVISGTIFTIFMFIENGNNDGGGGDTGGTDEIMLQYFDSTMPVGEIQFTHPVMNENDFVRIIPLGNINPPGHSFPTDHIYFVLNGFACSVFAPAGGKVLFIEEPGMYGDSAIRVSVTNSMTYYLGHIFVNENLEVGDTITAGDEIAISGNTSCVDFGLLNKDINNGFLSSNLPLTTIYGDKPLSYYTEPLRTQLYDSVTAPTPNPAEYPDYVYDENVTDGEFAIDELGALVGNWFMEGGIRLDGWYDWDKTLAFGYDVYYPEQIRIGCGLYQYAFALKNEDNPTRPEDVSTSSGIVTYYLYNASNTTIGLPTAGRIGIMVVQMLSDVRIKLQVFEDTTSTSREFTSEALFYIRDYV